MKEFLSSDAMRKASLASLATLFMGLGAYYLMENDVLVSLAFFILSFVVTAVREAFKVYVAKNHIDLPNE